MADRPRALMVTPVPPGMTGNGLVMRAGMTLRALAHHYRVSLLIVPLYASPSRRYLTPELAGLCEAVQGAQRSAGLPSGPIEGRFDTVHVFRLAAVPAAREWFPAAGQIHLDLDDVESVSRPRLAWLFREHGQLHEAEKEEREARRALESEIEVLSTFDRVYVCSTHDEESLPFCGSAEVRILPNAVDVPEGSLSRPQGDDLFTFLFIGNFGYLPNADGLTWFATRVLPRLRQVVPGQFRVRAAGMGATSELIALAGDAGIEMAGFAPDLAPFYASGHAALAPIRAGGGTRIKVLESFAYRRPVVSTSLGVEGIDARHGIHLLIADEPDAFARACRQLTEDPAIRDRLAKNAYDLARTRYSLDAMIQAVTPDLSDARPH